MKNTKKNAIAATLVAFATIYAGVSLAALTKEQAVEKAQKDYPGELIKAYQETKKGRQVWEVQIAGQDGKKWEIYYDVETGDLVEAESE